LITETIDVGEMTMAYLAAAHIMTIDYIIIGPYHADHFGCTPQVLAKYPINPTAYDRRQPFPPKKKNNRLKTRSLSSLVGRGTELRSRCSAERTNGLYHRSRRGTIARRDNLYTTFPRLGGHHYPIGIVVLFLAVTPSPCASAHATLWLASHKSLTPNRLRPGRCWRIR
jgi:hypothetical protein